MKTYVKPDLYYEDLQIAQHVATCVIDVNSNPNISCTGSITSSFDGMEGMAEMVIFNNNSCNMNSEDYMNFCDTNGADDVNRVFNS